MRSVLRIVCAVSLLALLAAAAVDQATPRSRMAKAAGAFLDSLGDELREQATLPFDHDNRRDWHYIPRSGEGVRLEQMNDAQRRAAHDLLRSALSEQGYLKATGIIFLEEVLREIESRPGREATWRDPGRYRFTVFGDPSSSEPWGWRVEGHHLSLNFSSIDEGRNAVTPFFMGSNPAIVPRGPKAGWRVLGSEEDVARELASSLNEGQRAEAIIAERAPRDILFGPGTDPASGESRGIAAGDLDDTQRLTLLKLIAIVCSNIDRDLHGPFPEEVADLDSFREVRFAWAGDLDAGRGHYWSVQGKTFIIEYDNTQNDANHIHLSWRDLTNDFGTDWLRDHIEREHGGERRSENRQ